MDFQDFQWILGNLGVETDHPPKMCAGLLLSSGLSRGLRDVLQVLQQHPRLQGLLARRVRDLSTNKPKPFGGVKAPRRSHLQRGAPRLQLLYGNA